MASGIALCLIFGAAIITFAVWYSQLRSPSILGTAEVRLQYANTAAGPWLDEIPGLFVEPQFNKAGPVIRNFYLKSTGADPQNHSLCLLAEGTVTQGSNPQGAIVGGDIRKYFSVESYKVGNVEYKPSIVDKDGDSQKTIFDLETQDINNPSSCVAFGSNEATSVSLTMQAYSSMLQVDDLHGDSWAGNLIFVLR